MVKATQTEEPAKQDKKVKAEVAKPLLNQEDMLKKFGKLDAKTAEFEQISTKIKVDTKESLAVAENHSSRLQEILNNIELVRTTLKSPYFQTSKAIDAYAKVLREPLERCKQRINTQITSFKELAAAQERQRIEKETQEREEKERKKNDEIERLARIKKQLYARIYGGVYYLKDGTRQTNAGCQNTADCDKLSEFIDQRFPGIDSFQYLKAEISETRDLGIKHLTEHKANLIDLSSQDEATREQARVNIANAKNEAEVEAIEEVETLKKTVEKESAAEQRQDDKALKAAKKGVRETVKFTIEDESVVPVDFKVVDESLVNSYIRNNSERIKEMLKNNEQPIPGITFYVGSKFVTSG